MTSAKGLAARVGAEIADRWYIDALVGVGGSAAVYSATHRNGHRVAVKVLHDELGSADGGERVVAAFIREGAVCNQVRHPGIVPVYDDGFLEDGCPFLVMELLTGRTLDGAVKGKDPALGWREAVSVARAVAEVLAEAHAVGLVHRDVKPGNIFVCHSDYPWFYPGRIRLLDFGIALLEDQAPLSGVLGTPAFLPPEQARAGLGRRASGVGPHSDQWALAATALSLLRGKPIRGGDTEAELLMRTLQPVPAAATFNLAAPPILLDVFDRALSFDPADRFPSMAAFVAALDSAVHESAQWDAEQEESPATINIPSASPSMLLSSVQPVSPPPNVNLLFSVWNAEVELPEAPDSAEAYVARPQAHRPVVPPPESLPYSSVNSTLPTLARPPGLDAALAAGRRPYEDGSHPQIPVEAGSDPSLSTLVGGAPSAGTEPSPVGSPVTPRPRGSESAFDRPPRPQIRRKS